MNEFKEKKKGGLEAAADLPNDTFDQSASTSQNIKQAAGKACVAVSDEAKSASGAIATLAEEAKDKAQEWSNEALEVAKQTGEKVQQWATEAYEGTAATMKTFGSEATEMVKKFPIPALLIGFGVGVLIGRAVRA